MELPLFHFARARRLRLFLRSRNNSVRETNAQPAPATGLFTGFGVRPQQAETAVSSLCGNKDTACYNGDTPKNGGDDRPMQRFTPKLQWEGTGLTRHCLSCHARLCKLSAGPPIAAFDLRRLKNGNAPYIRVTKQAESVVGSGGRRLKPFLIWEVCK